MVQSFNAKFFQDAFLGECKTFKERLLTEREERLKHKDSNLSLGMAFLDDAAGGIHDNDLIVVSGMTGGGKSQLASTIAMKNAANGKRVHFYALEAEKNEIERRIKYQYLANVFFRQGLYQRFPQVQLNYMDWYYGKLDHALGQFEPEIDEQLQDLFPGLKTVYGGSSFTVEDLKRDLLAIQHETDLVIVDHLHYFDFYEENENRAVKAAMKTIRELALDIGKPVVLLAQLRKIDKRARTLVPSEQDLHGSSDIAKIATKVVTMAPAYDIEGAEKTEFPTYIRLAKCRTDNSRARYAAVASFDSTTQQYKPGYMLGKLSYAEDEVAIATMRSMLPYWAKNAIVPGER